MTEIQESIEIENTPLEGSRKSNVVPITGHQREGYLFLPDVLVPKILRLAKGHSQLMVLLCLVRYSLNFNRSTCVASRAFIAKWTGIDRCNVRRILKDLIQQGVIIHLADRKLSAGIRVFEIPFIAEYLSQSMPLNQTSNQNLPGVTVTTKWGYDDHKSGITVTPNNTNTIQKNTKLRDSLNLNGQVIYPEAFEKLYAQYPRKEGKTPGYRIYRKQILSSKDENQLAAAIANYRRAKAGTKTEFLLHFSTFMNQWRDWLDSSSLEEASAPTLRPRTVEEIFGA